MSVYICIILTRLSYIFTSLDPRILVFNDTATTEIYTALNTLSLHDALPISLNPFRGFHCSKLVEFVEYDCILQGTSKALVGGRDECLYLYNIDTIKLYFYIFRSPNPDF